MGRRANGRSWRRGENPPPAITPPGGDPAGAGVTFSVVSGPANGTLSGSGASLTYTPAANYNGADSFTFVVNDGSGDSAPATISINVTAVNDAPSANAQSVTAAGNTPLAITLTGADLDGDGLTF